MFPSMLVVVSLLTLSVSALTTPHHNARDTSLAARHHHIARQANNHSIVRRSARRKRCLEKTALAFSSSSAADTTTSTSGNSVLGVPVNVAPEPVTSTTPAAAQPTTPYVAPQPTTTPTPTPTPTDVEIQASGGGQTFTGDGTFFDVGLGACGQTSSNSDYIVAIGWQLFDSFSNGDPNPNRNSVCGRRIRATFGGKSVTVVVLDRCGGCQPHDLDFSPSAFDQLADRNLGRLKGVQWQFI